jgi:hypothetical protein
MTKNNNVPLRLIRRFGLQDHNFCAGGDTAEATAKRALNKALNRGTTPSEFETRAVELPSTGRAGGPSLHGRSGPLTFKN